MPFLSGGCQAAIRAPVFLADEQVQLAFQGVQTDPVAVLTIARGPAGIGFWAT